MGSKETRSQRSAELRRAEELRQALRIGAHSVHLPASRPPAPCTDTSECELLQNLELQTAFLDQLVECAPEAISILDSQFRITRVNSEFTRMFGFSQEEILHRPIRSVIVPPDRDSETRWIGEMLRENERVVMETKRQRKDGTLLDVSISAAPVIVHGEHVAFYVLYRDISERIRTAFLNSALYRIAEKSSSAIDLQQFYEAVHHIVGELMYARNFYIALHDPATQVLSFPYFVDEVDEAPSPKQLGRGLTEYVLRTGEPLLCTPEIFEDLVERGEVELIGAPSLDWLGVPLKTGGRTLGAVVLQSYSENVRFQEKDKDILTFVSQQLASAIEHKRHEEALRNSEARYRSLVQSAVYGIFRISVTGQFLDVNPALVSMLGYDSADEIRTLDAVRDVFVSQDLHHALLSELACSNRVEHFEVDWRRKDGHVIAVRLSGRAVSGDKESDGILELIAEDITERRALEDQVRQAQKMEAVGRLAGGVAHDFNNLLTVINGYTEVLIDETYKKPALRENVEAIQHAAERASSLTSQLLAFSRKQVLELKITDLNQIVSSLERLLRPLIGNNVELRVRLASDLGRVRADQSQVEQVLMNLVVNAKDAMPEGGNLTIQTANIQLDDKDCRRYRYLLPGSYVMLSVSDTGIGMDEETQSRIFEPFFTTKEKGKGTGLGLSTVYGIVKQSGGYILAESERGQGTTFRIYLPRVRNVVDEQQQVRETTSISAGSETVLLVEDEESVRQLVGDTLRKRGYKVIEAEHADAALAAASAHKDDIHLLVTDIILPGMNGGELSKHLCQSRPEMKVLFLSGYTEDGVTQKGVLRPGTAFLQKPFTLQAFSRRVREVLGTQKA